MNCVDCKAAGVTAAATRIQNGKGYCSSHARKYFKDGFQLPPDDEIAQIAHQEETKMGARKKLDRKQIAADYASGMSADQIAAKHCAHHTTIRVILKKEGVYKPGVWGGPRKPREEHAEIVKASETHTKIDRAESNTGETPVPQKANGHARCRVAMFEVEGDAAAVLHAVDAIKGALESRR